MTGREDPTLDADLGAVQQTLFVTLAARARETRRRHPALRDPRAVELVESISYDTRKYGRGSGGSITVLRTAIFDWWVRQFLAGHPDGLVVEIGTGLNTRFDRVDNGQVRWIDLDLPDTVELRRRFFTDTARRHMMAGSALDEDWLDAVAAQPGPYFFAVEGVLAYLPEADVHQVLSRISQRFPGTLVALDSYPRRTLDQQHKMAARKNIPARWAWSCDDPRELERLGLRVVESTGVTRPPAGLRATLPRRYRLALPLADPVFGRALALTLFRVPEAAPAG